MGRRKKLEVKREFGTPIQEFADKGFIPQSSKDLMKELDSKPNPLDDSEIVVSETAEAIHKTETKLEEMEEKYASLLDERDEWKRKYEELLKEKTPVDNSFEIAKIKSEYDLKESLLLAKIENLTNELRQKSEKAYTNPVNQQLPPSGFSSVMVRPMTKKLPNGYESW